MTEKQLNEKLVDPEARKNAETHCPHCGAKIVPQQHRAGGGDFPQYECGTTSGGFPQSPKCKKQENPQPSKI
jgi:hypothetical protein